MSTSGTEAGPGYSPVRTYPKPANGQGNPVVTGAGYTPTTQTEASIPVQNGTLPTPRVSYNDAAGYLSRQRQNQVSRSRGPVVGDGKPAGPSDKPKPEDPKQPEFKTVQDAAHGSSFEKDAKTGKLSPFYGDADKAEKHLKSSGDFIMTDKTNEQNERHGVQKTEKGRREFQYKYDKEGKFTGGKIQEKTKDKDGKDTTFNYDVSKTSKDGKDSMHFIKKDANGKVVEEGDWPWGDLKKSDQKIKGSKGEDIGRGTGYGDEKASDPDKKEPPGTKPGDKDKKPNAPDAKPGEKPKNTNHKVVHVDDSNFKDEVLNSKVPVLIKFGAEWCGPCRGMKPVLDKLALGNDFKVVSIDTDKSSGLFKKYGKGGGGIPAFEVFNNGTGKGWLIGGQSEDQLKRFVRSNS